MFGDKKIKIKDSERSLISETVSIEGTINSSGAIDVAGLVKGPVYSKELIVRDTGSITGTIEGTALGVVKDVKSTYHYSTCVFTKATCGDLDLDWKYFEV